MSTSRTPKLTSKHVGDLDWDTSKFIIKKFIVDDYDEDDGGQLELVFRAEIKAYQALCDVTYNTSNGKQMFLVPQCFEIGIDYMIFERYETSLFDYIDEGDINSIQLLKIIRSYIDPIVMKLDQIGISHYDIAFRNFVLDKDLSRFAIIDFGLSSFDGKHTPSSTAYNFGSSTLFELTASLDLDHLYPTVREITLWIINNGGFVGEVGTISAHDLKILNSIDFKKTTKEQLLSLKFECPEMDVVELTKIWHYPY
jgi:serine/threonine protein kinase